MNALAPINDKLSILIPLLASDKDGEVVATARAIGRQLQKTGSDWHDLAARLTAPAVKHHPEPDADCGGVTNYREAVNWIIANDDGGLSEKECRFVRDMRRYLSRSSSPTPKQADWIDALLERTGGCWV